MSTLKVISIPGAVPSYYLSIKRSTSSILFLFPSWSYTFLSCMLAIQSYQTFCNPMDCSPPSSSVHGIVRARILEWVATSFSRGSSWSRDWTQVSWIAGGFYNVWATREAPFYLESLGSDNPGYKLMLNILLAECLYGTLGNVYICKIWIILYPHYWLTVNVNVKYTAYAWHITSSPFMLPVDFRLVCVITQSSFLSPR